MSTAGGSKAITPPDIQARKGASPVVWLTAYTMPIAKLVDRHCDIVLIGDSVGMVLRGAPQTTLVCHRRRLSGLVLWQSVLGRSA